MRKIKIIWDDVRTIFYNKTTLDKNLIYLIARGRKRIFKFYSYLFFYNFQLMIRILLSKKWSSVCPMYFFLVLKYLGSRLCWSHTTPISAAGSRPTAMGVCIASNSFASPKNSRVQEDKAHGEDEEHIPKIHLHPPKFP